MTLSKRSFLKSGAAVFAASALTMPTSAMAIGLGGGGGAGKVNVQDISVVAYVEGEGAPKPAKIRLSDRDIKRLNETDPGRQSRVLAEIMNAALSKAWGLKFDGIDGESLDRVNGGKGLGEGENDLRIQTKGPKWEIKLTIVIKF